MGYLDKQVVRSLLLSVDAALYVEDLHSTTGNIDFWKLPDCIFQHVQSRGARLDVRLGP